MIETPQLLRCLRRLALARTPAETGDARAEAAILLGEAGWDLSPHAVRAQLRDEQHRPPDRPAAEPRNP